MYGQEPKFEKRSNFKEINEADRGVLYLFHRNMLMCYVYVLLIAVAKSDS